MEYVSLFSGIEAATVAFRPLGWQALAFSEIEDFPNAILAHHYPEVPNLGDITQIDWTVFKEKHGIVTDGSLPLVIGGSPCQSFSVAGDRDGLAGESRLMFEFIRAIREVRPQWLIWENVPGALSSDDGDAFRQLLSELSELGYLLAWRVLDAQFFGVAQRRRRVFLVGRLGRSGPVEVLFDRESLRWDYPSNREQRQTLTARRKTSANRPASISGKTTTTSISNDSTHLSAKELSNPIKTGMHNRQTIATTSISGDPTPKHAQEIATPLTAHDGTSGSRHSIVTLADGMGKTTVGENMTGTLHVAGDPPCVVTSISRDPSAVCAKETDNIAPTIDTTASPAVCLQGTIIGRQDHNGPQGSGVNDNLAFTLNTVDRHAVAFKVRQGHTGSGGRGALASDDLAFTCSTNQDQYVSSNGYARYLTPRECERLMGFSDDYTRIPYRGKPAEQCPDSPRYKALGNSIAVPVLAWIGKRINDIMEQEKNQ